MTTIADSADMTGVEVTAGLEEEVHEVIGEEMKMSAFY